MISKNLAATRKLMRLIDETAQLKISMELELNRVRMEIEDIVDPESERAQLEEPADFILSNRSQLRRLEQAANDLGKYAKRCHEEYTAILNECTEE